MTRTYSWLVAVVLFTGGCSSQKAADQGESPSGTVHQMMVKHIAPDADAVWAIGNDAMGDDGSIDPALMSEEKWRTLEQGARQMETDAKRLAALDPITVTRTGEKIADEGTEGSPTAVGIQAHIATNPDVFRALAGTLAQHGTDLAAASARKDAATAGRLVGEIDGVCESCHLQFWYPEQNAQQQASAALTKVAAVEAHHKG